MTRYYYMVVSFQTPKGVGYKAVTASSDGAAPIVAAMRLVKTEHPEAIRSSLLITTCIELDEEQFNEYRAMLDAEHPKGAS